MRGRLGFREGAGKKRLDPEGRWIKLWLAASYLSPDDSWSHSRDLPPTPPESPQESTRTGARLIRDFVGAPCSIRPKTIFEAQVG